MKMPNPIAIRFAKLIFSILSITVLGVIFAMISHDHTASLPTMSNRALRLTMPQARASWQIVLSRRSRRRLR